MRTYELTDSNERSIERMNEPREQTNDHVAGVGKINLVSRYMVRWWAFKI